MKRKRISAKLEREARILDRAAYFIAGFCSDKLDNQYLLQRINTLHMQADRLRKLSAKVSPTTCQEVAK